MSAERKSTLLVFSDLDGSLLDHHSYSLQEALPTVMALNKLGIPLILSSSKTRAEMIALRSKLGNEDPFIVENGAAVFIPRQYFSRQPANTDTRGEYWAYEMAPSRDHWLTVLSTLQNEYADDFTSFYSAGVAGIMAMTGLSEAQATAANDRDYSEPVQWTGDPQMEPQFIRRLKMFGASVTKGGRFLSVSGNCNKGRAMIWLRDCFHDARPSLPVEDLAIGDSNNDIPMLEAARTALLIRSPEHDFPFLEKVDGVIHSKYFGHEGWTEGVSTWLHLNGLST